MNGWISDFRLAAMAVVTGDRIIDLDDELEFYGGDQSRLDRLKQATGLARRAVVSANQTALDLGEQAARRLFSEGQVDPATIDACIFVTQSPDHFQPCNSALLHGRLGLDRRAACWDVALGCSGWVYGLAQAAGMMQSGFFKNVLLVAGDTLSRQVDPGDRATVPLFGDAASATLLTHEAGRRSFFSLQTNGRGAEVIRVPAGAFRQSVVDQPETIDNEGKKRPSNGLLMDGPEVFKFTLKEVPAQLQSVLEKTGTDAETVSHFFFHQANGYILSNLQRKLKLPVDKVPMATIGRYGNLSSASIPTAICDTFENSSNSAVRPGLSIISGFGVGLSWATALVDLTGIHCLPITSYASSN